MGTSTQLQPPHTQLSRADFERFYEVVNGERVENLPMGNYENQVASIILHALFAFTQPRRMGWAIMENLFVFDRGRKTWLRPDVAYVSRERWPHSRVPDGEAWDVVPDLAVEVISVSNTHQEIVTKLDEYFRASVRLVWVVYPELQQAHVYHAPTNPRILKRTDELDGEEVIPGFRLAVATLFEEMAD